MYCGKCGKEIENNATICKWCGEPTEIEPENTENTETENTENTETENTETESTESNGTQQEKKTTGITMWTKLGVSLGILAAGVYWLGMASELAALLLIAYILLKEDNCWLKENALKAGIIIVGFLVIQGAIGIFSDVVNSFKSLLSIAITFDSYNTPLDKLCSMLISVCNVAKNVILLIAGYQAFRYQNFRITFIDRIVHRNIDR